MSAISRMRSAGYVSSQSSVTTTSPTASLSARIMARPYPWGGNCRTTRAPSAAASSGVRSLLLSTTRISQSAADGGPDVANHLFDGAFLVQRDHGNGDRRHRRFLLLLSLPLAVQLRGHPEPALNALVHVDVFEFGVAAAQGNAKGLEVAFRLFEMAPVIEILDDIAVFRAAILWRSKCRRNARRSMDSSPETTLREHVGVVQFPDAVAGVGGDFGLDQRPAFGNIAGAEAAREARGGGTGAAGRERRWRCNRAGGGRRAPPSR